MAKKKPVCPQCGSEALRITRTFCLMGECHYLERKRLSYYHCDECGCDCLLTTPEGELKILKNGVVTRDMALRVLAALNLPRELAEKLR